MSAEARRYCIVPMSSTTVPPQKPKGGQGGARIKATTNSWEKHSMVCTSCVMSRLGERPAIRAAAARAAKVEDTLKARFMMSHQLGL
mmetsp:Transcript_4287/g.7764  ORF Transcript_4287/g.7764 Transcript_4287/m.7764 type:complete len:87 (-) Transcript_4287:556-816(-)